jgi:hypothetical protein
MIRRLRLYMEWSQEAKLWQLRAERGRHVTAYGSFLKNTILYMNLV